MKTKETNKMTLGVNINHIAVLREAGKDQRSVFFTPVSESPKSSVLPPDPKVQEYSYLDTNIFIDIIIIVKAVCSITKRKIFGTFATTKMIGF